MGKPITLEHIGGMLTGLKFGFAVLSIALGVVQLLIGAWVKLIIERVKKLECAADTTSAHGTEIAVIKQRIRSGENRIDEIADLHDRLVVLETEHKAQKERCR